MPLWDSSAPRKKFPPPTTMATSTSGTAAAICLATLKKGYPAGSGGRNRQWSKRTVAASVWAHAKGAATEVATPLQFRLGAYAEARERGSLDTGLFEDLCHGLLRVLGECLVNQDLALVEAGYAAFHNLGEGSFRLALGLGGLFGDAALGLDELGRNVLTGEVVRGHGGNVHGDVVGGGGGGFAFTVDGEQHADLGREVLGGLVQVGVNRRTLNAGDAADDDLLAQDGAFFNDNLGERLAVNVGGQQGLEVGSAGLDSDTQDLVGQLDELVSLGDEVGLAVDLDHDADPVADLGGHEAFSGGAALALGSALEALDADDLDGLLGVTVGFVKSLLDVHHAGA